MSTIQNDSGLITWARSDNRRKGVRQSARAEGALLPLPLPRAPTRVRDAPTSDTAHVVSSLRARCNFKY